MPCPNSRGQGEVLSDFFSFENVLKGVGAWGNIQASKQKSKVDYQNSINEAKKLELQTFEARTAATKETVDAAARLQNGQTLYAVAGAAAVALVTAILGGVIVKLIKAWRRK